MKKRKTSDLVFAILWFIAGVATLCAPEVSKISYGLCWAMVVLQYSIDYVFGNVNYTEGYLDGVRDVVNRSLKIMDETREEWKQKQEENKEC